MADVVEAYVVVQYEDSEVKHVLGPGAGYSTMFDGDLIRVYDESTTRLINAERIVELCIPNRRPR